MDVEKEFIINMKKWPRTGALQSTREQVVSFYFRICIFLFISDENNWDGCHYNHQLPCYKNEQKCEVTMTLLGGDTQILNGDNYFKATNNLQVKF